MGESQGRDNCPLFDEPIDDPRYAGNTYPDLSYHLRDAAESIRRAVEKTLAEGLGTPDLGGELSTREMADEIVGRMKDE